MDLSGVFAVLDPKGVIALAERGLIINATLLMLIVVVPVFILLFFFAWHYRAGNTKAKYVPKWEHAKMDELIWWAIPFEIVLVLAALTWSSTHALDPHKPLESAVPPVTVQAVALNWKWLFIYPQYGIATVNYLQIPVDTPINFRITADAPMNALWIPELGGMIYAMTGMVTKLHLEASRVGAFAGSSSNYSGEGFAGMRFVVLSSSQEDFDTWVRTVQNTQSTLNPASYATLAEPSEHHPREYYGRVSPNLFDTIVGQFNLPTVEARSH